MKTNKSFFGLFLAALTLLPGCMHVPTYKSKPLKSMETDFTYHQAEQNVIVQAKKLTAEEIQYIFGARADHLIDSVQVISLSVHNLSNSCYHLFVQNDYVALSVREVARLMKTSSVARMASGIVSGATVSVTANFLFVTGTMLILQPPSAIWIPYALIFGLPIATVIGALPFFGKSIKSMIMNHRLKKDLREKIVKDKIMINSGEHYKGLIFVKSSDYKPIFTVTMQEKNNNNIVFVVNLELEA
ncbi:MAG TPA: hypothetical protein VKU36_01120 [Candidatus Babeliales bacterium]|nr:hypothetical protein [Candidatus Babeliales bacterium]